MKRKLLLTVLLSATLVLSSACNGNQQNNDVTKLTNSSTTESTTKQQEVIKPQEGGTLTIASRNPTTFNPLLNEDESVDNMLSLIYDKLVILDENMKPSSNIVQSWERSESGLVLKLNLRQDITWHNGTKLTAKDVVFSLDTIKKSQDSSAYKACVNNISSYSALDDYTVEIKYRQVFSGYAYSLNFPIISSDYYSGEDVFNSDKNMKPMGTGAYSFESFTTMEEVKLVKNTQWFKGTPYIDYISVKILPDKETELYSFEQGTVDFITTDVVDWGKYNNSKETTIYEYTTNYYDFIGINFNNSILSNDIVRKALAYAVPREQIVEEIYLNHAVITDTPVNPNSWLKSSESLKYICNTELAKSMVEQMGWTDTDNDGILDNNGQKLSFTMLVNNENEHRVAVAEMIKESLGKMGVELNLDLQDYETYTQKLYAKDFDLVYAGWKLSIIPDLTFAFHSSQISGGSNFISYQNSRMDSLLQQAFSATDENSLYQVYDNIQDLIIEDLPYISLYFRNTAVLADEKVKGEINSNFNEIFSGMENLYIYEK